MYYKSKFFSFGFLQMQCVYDILCIFFHVRFNIRHTYILNSHQNLYPWLIQAFTGYLLSILQHIVYYHIRKGKQAKHKMMRNKQRFIVK